MKASRTAPFGGLYQQIWGELWEIVFKDPDRADELIPAFCRKWRIPQSTVEAKLAAFCDGNSTVH